MEKTNYKAVFWDLDGTLADTAPGVINAVKYTSKKMKLSILTDDKYIKFVGPPNKESYGTFFNLRDNELERAISYHKEYACSQGVYEARLYPEIKKTLSYLREKGYKQAVATLKLQESAEKLLLNLGIADCFDCIIGAGDVGFEKADIIRIGMDKLGVEPEECVLIGDSKYDAEGAKKAGIDFIPVLYGYGFKSAKEIYDKFDYICILNSEFDIQTIL